MASFQNQAYGMENIANFPAQNKLCNPITSRSDLLAKQFCPHLPNSMQLNMSEAKIKSLSNPANSIPDLELAYKQHFEELYRYAFSLLKEETQAEDAVQSVFMEGWQNIGKLEIHTSLRAFLFKAVYFKCMNEIKHQQVRRKFEFFISTKKEVMHMDGPLQHELKQKIEEALQTLPTECRKVFELCKLEGLKYHEAADQLNLSPKTVENQMGKALKTLRMALSRYLFPVTLLIMFWS